MPKIIQNIREQLLTEAKKQIAERGYKATTIRSVASACGLGVGTVYNYFPSKEMLIASFVYEDWKNHLSAMQRLSSDDPYIRLKGIYDSLTSFSEENRVLFSDTDAARLISAGSAERHKLLRAQIASLILPVCENPPSPFAAEFAAEAIIRWSTEHADFETIYPFLAKIIKD